jgi:hypothetical protein
MTNGNDFDDDLSDLIGRPMRPASELKQPPASYVQKDHIETCPKCNGTGRFVSWSGRVMGNCFTCKGAGKKTFKTSSADRAKARDQAAVRRQAKAADDDATRIAAIEAYTAAHPDAIAWLGMNQGKFDFATSVYDGFLKFGRLTDGQLAAVERCIARDKDRKAAAQARVDAAPAVDMSKIEAAFATARQNAKDLGAMGIRWLTLRLDTFKFLDAPAKGQYSAAVLVREGDAKLGRIADGKFVRSFSCDDPTEARILAAAADPKAAAIAYGMKYSSCSICGRELTNAESIKLGIGPICAGKFGW